MISRLDAGIGLQDAIIVKDNNGQEGNRINDVAKRNGSLFVTWKPELGWYAETGLTLEGDRFADPVHLLYPNHTAFSEFIAGAMASSLARE